MSEQQRSDVVLAVEGELARMVRMTRRVLLHHATRFAEGVTPAGYWVMRYIAMNHPTAPGTLVAELDMDKSAVSRHLRTLHELGFVTGEPDPADRRARLFAPSAAALARMAELKAETQSLYADAFDDWADADLTAFARLLTEFNDRIERR